MKEQKIFIKNRLGQKICVLVEKIESQKGLVFIMHGLGGYNEQPRIIVFAESFQKCGYTTIRFDATNSLGESDGQYKDSTDYQFL